jgi:hypothetical protein
MTDRGLTALTAAIHSLHHHITIANGQPSPDFDGEFASAILGERRVFLPEGLGLMRSNAEGLIAVGKQLVCAEAEIARLRAAADGIPLLLTDITERDTTIATLLAALDLLRADDLWLGVELHAVGNLMFPEPMVSASGARAAILAALDAAKGLS